MPQMPWDNGDETRLRYESKNAQKGSSVQHARRQVPARLRPLEAMLERTILGQMAQPPNTAIAVPLQQAISNLQSGGRGSLPGGMSNLPNAGLQSREQLGLPDRKSYFPGVPGYDEIAALGAFPGIPPNPQTRKAQKKEGVAPSKKELRRQEHPEIGGK